MDSAQHFFFKWLFSSEADFQKDIDKPIRCSFCKDARLNGLTSLHARAPKKVKVATETGLIPRCDIC